MMNKKAEGLPMATVVIGILVLIVLVLVILFFTGGTSKIGEKISMLFKGSVGGDDLATVIQFCKGYCDKTELLTEEQIKESPYCTKSFFIDKNGDGEAEYDDAAYKAKKGKIYTEFYCSSLGKAAAESKQSGTAQKSPKEDIGINCPKVLSC